MCMPDHLSHGHRGVVQHVERLKFGLKRQGQIGNGLLAIHLYEGREPHDFLAIKGAWRLISALRHVAPLSQAPRR